MKKIALVLILALLLSIVGYLLYVVLTYSRIPDNVLLDVDGGAEEQAVRVGKEYTIVTQNIGFGAYTDDFTFFMDGGKESRAESAESVKACINAALDKVSSLNPDFILFQEVDLDSTRSHHIDQYAMLRERLLGFSSVKAINYDSAYLMYPFLEPHGASYSSMATFSHFEIDFNSSLV